MKDEHRTAARWAFRAIALLLLGLLAYWGGLAAQHAYARQLGPWVISFAVGAAIVTVAAWFYPRASARVIMGLGAVLVVFSLAVAFVAGLVWEPFVGCWALLAAELISSSLSALWWPLRTLSAEDRRAVFRRLRQFPYRERRRIIWSRQYDQFLTKGDSPQ